MAFQPQGGRLRAVGAVQGAVGCSLQGWQRRLQRTDSLLRALRLRHGGRQGSQHGIPHL